MAEHATADVSGNDPTIAKMQKTRLDWFLNARQGRAHEDLRQRPHQPPR